MTATHALFATLLGLAPAAQAAALTCGELAGRTFGNARILETQDVSGRLPLKPRHRAWLASAFAARTLLVATANRPRGTPGPAPSPSTPTGGRRRR
jgi:hypothetical protein